MKNKPWEIPGGGLCVLAGLLTHDLKKNLGGVVMTSSFFEVDAASATDGAGSCFEVPRPVEAATDPFPSPLVALFLFLPVSLAFPLPDVDGILKNRFNHNKIK